MEIEPVAYYRGPFPSKFGLPRQSGIIAEVCGRVELTDAFAQPEALRGLEDYDYVWLIWGFSAHETAPKHPTVRPPLLGGNRRMGVWATRSSFRPNNLGLSSVRVTRVDAEQATIEVLGADLMDGTPIYDIKPYLPYVDSHADARGGFTDRHPWQQLQVEIAPEVCHRFAPDQLQVLTSALSLDPRPHYHRDDSRQYGMPFDGWNIVFRVEGDTVHVVDAVKL